jgi:NADH-quinone oxidoreductase subunit J
MVTAVFYASVVVGVISAVLAVSHRNPVVNVLSLVVTLFCVAVNYALLGAEFLAAAQVLIYAGAILVLFLFVVMLLNAPEVPQTSETRPFQRFGGALLVAAAVVGGIAVLAHFRPPVPTVSASGNAHAIGRLLVGPYLFSFELVSVVLLAALVGALVLVKRKH